MAVAVKICGLTDPDAVAAACAGGARYLGFVFFPPSPRALTPAQAAALAAAALAGPERVGVFVDPGDALLDEVLGVVLLDLLQVHGVAPARLAAIRARCGRRVIGCLPVAEPADLAPLAELAAIADLVLFDAKPPQGAALPGGNGLAFDWRLLQGVRPGRPWLLAGGLNDANLAAAVELCRPDAVDVSSGLEIRPGVKDPARIAAFLHLAAGLEPAATRVAS
jgi:phosphoribosylanthranilate isomerase